MADNFLRQIISILMGHVQDPDPLVRVQSLEQCRVLSRRFVHLRNSAEHGNLLRRAKKYVRYPPLKILAE